MVEKLFKGFIGVGAAVLAIQLAAARFLPAPDCAGSLGHTLIDRYFRGVDDSTLLAGGASRTSFPAQLVVKVVMWLPDFYSEVLAGDMKVRDYLRGGPVCHPRPRLTMPAVGFNPLFPLPGGQPKRSGK
jgi:hypothetical protein